MRISRIRISNILGIDELEFDAGQFTSISGQNGQGKTSVLEAIKAVAQGGHDATLLRRGAEKGEAVLLLDDGREIGKTVTPTGSTQFVRDGGKKVQRPAEVIRSLVDQLSVNPVDFLLAPKKERVRVLLEAMPLEADVERLAQMSGVQVKVAAGTHALAVIDAVHKQVYDFRTGTNRAVREKEATIIQLRQALPEAPGGVEGDEGGLQQRIDAAAQSKDAELGRVAKKLTGIRDEAGAKIAVIRDKLQADIDALKVAAQAEVDAINGATAEFERKAAAQREKTINTHATATQPVQSALDAIRANRDAAARRQGTLDMITVLEGELEALQGDAARQTQALADIDAYKSELLSMLPIPGLEVKDGEVLRDGVAFDRLNTAQQVDVAVEIAKVRAGELGVICVDRIECLDSASLERFRSRALDSGLQLFVSRVADEDLSITAEDR